MTVRTPRSLALIAALGLLALAGCSAPSADRAAAKTAAASSTGAPAVASSASPALSLDAVRSFITAASHGSVEATSVFAGEDGMTGVVTEGQGKPKEIVWLSPNGKLLFPGPAITKDGRNLSQEALAKFYMQPSELADKVLASGNGFVVGSKGPILTAFMDPNCIWCHELYMNIMPLVNQGKLRVRFVIVGILKESSVPRGVAILASDDPAAALAKDEKSFDKRHEEGGMAPATGDHPEAEAKLREVTQLMHAAGPVSTPALLFCNKNDGGKLTYQQGYPRDIKGFAETVSTGDHTICSAK